jgi:hypothetical protein
MLKKILITIVLIIILFLIILKTNTATDGGYMPFIPTKEYICSGKFITISDNSISDGPRIRFCVGYLQVK